MINDFSVEVGSEKLKFNTGYLARQADGSVLVSYGETIVLAVAVASRNAPEDRDFLPLTVDYREKYYSAGKIPGGFIKREGRPKDKETLVSRLADRPIRPLFKKGFANEVQVILNVLSVDRETQQDIVAINAASAALVLSGVPYKEPIGAVRVGKIDGNYVVNPTFTQSGNSTLDLIVAGTSKAVTMIEGSAKGVSEDEICQAIEFAHSYIMKICDVQEDMKKQCGKPEIEYTPRSVDEMLIAELKKNYYPDIENLKNYTDKKEREKSFESLVDRAVQELEDRFPDTIYQVRSIIEEFDAEIVRKRIIDENSRADGRGPKDIRPIDIMIGLLPRTHGSAVFTRGQTQSLGIVTLGTSLDSQKLDSIEGESYKRFMLHYNFPNFSVGEVGRLGGVGRREIGHGMLAERSLEYVMPDELAFPYTVRVVSEILESNGSSSMASVCSGSLSLLNAGVPIKSPVAGIAMGLVIEGDKYAILSDILGLEDHLGDMDFKVAGTAEGITGFQMDIKIDGISPELMKEVLFQAREGRLHILNKMNEVISKPEEELSPYAPRIFVMMIDKDKIGEIIGPGGRVIKDIVEYSGAEVNIDNDGKLTISSIEKSGLDKAIERINAIIKDVEVGATYHGKVIKIMEYGAFVEILPGKDGLVHISKLGIDRGQRVSDVLNEGDDILVKVIGIDEIGRIDLRRVKG
ncbi:MAG: polyribonucleotide nucleotidyltransferase [Spirochaetota bacterium]|nr:polyribonucleotide nucleotidyltransferase [Spirochaetota bacterium]